MTTDSTATANSKPAQASVSAAPSLFWLNVVVLCLVGVALSIWLIYYTSIFPEVAGLLALGGALSWIGCVLGLLSESRTTDLQAWTETRVLGSAHTLLILSFAGLVLVLIGNFRGGIQLEPYQESLEHTVQITAVGEALSEPLHLLPGGQLRWTEWTCWWCRTKVSIKVSGYPEKQVEIRPWRRVPVYVPSSLVRPVVLLHPSVALIDAVKDTSMTLEVSITEADHPTLKEKAPFDGHAIWIGGDDDILVPADTEARWLQELTSLKSLNHLSFWLPPVAPPTFHLPLRAGQDITLVLHNNNHNDQYEEVSFKVRPLHSSREFVQEVELDVPPETP